VQTPVQTRNGRPNVADCGNRRGVVTAFTLSHNRDASIGECRCRRARGQRCRLHAL